MPVPDYQSIMLPLLRFASDGNEHHIRSAIEFLAEEFSLSESELQELLPSGRQATFDNRVGWARTYLKKAGLLQSPRRAYFQITDRGLSVLAMDPPRIDNAFLKQYPEFLQFQTTAIDKGPKDETPDTLQTPEEAIEAAYLEYRQSLASELLTIVKKCPPEFFERLVVDLLVTMGYGGTRQEAGKAVGRSGDEGIDGIINEDRLGLDTVYIQAKRWEDPVSRPEIQKFAGALLGQKAHRGVFITTSAFTRGARDFANGIESRIILIDGEMLADLMIDYNIGVNGISSYELKRIDGDYFAVE